MVLLEILFLICSLALAFTLAILFFRLPLRECWPWSTCSPARGGSFSSSSLNIRPTKEPPVFGGNLSTSVSFQEWVFTVKVAVEAADLSGQQEVSFATSYLTGNALAWFLARRGAGKEFENCMAVIESSDIDSFWPYLHRRRSPS